jgi:histidine triad (HIT) family protein
MSSNCHHAVVTDDTHPDDHTRRPLDDDERKHIDLIQAAVARMASASSTAKGWLLPVVTATYGYALTQDDPQVAGLGLAAVLLFGTLDAHYLRQERAFRALYRAAVERRVPVYEMNSGRFFGKPNRDEDDERHENCKWRHVIFSWSVGGFYGPIVTLGGVLICCAT